MSLKPKDGGAGLGCAYCAGEPEPGRIEMPNNGPIVDCPMCSRVDDYTKAERQRATMLSARGGQTQ